MTGKQYQIIVRDFVMDIPTRTKKISELNYLTSPSRLHAKTGKDFLVN